MLETGNSFEWLSNINILQILIPALIGLFTPILLTHFNSKYSIKKEKNKYLSFLKYQSHTVNDFLIIISTYKAKTSARYFILIEGILIGFVFPYKISDYIAYIFKILANTFLVKILPNLIVYTLPSYSIKDFNVNFFLIISSFNYLSVAVAIFIFVWIIFLEEKDYSLPKIKEDMSLTKRSLFVYYSYWFLTGLLIGINIFILFFTLIVIFNFNPKDQNLSISWTCLSNIFTNLITQMTAEKGLGITASYVYGFYASISAILLTLRCIIDFTFNFNKLIDYFYITKFPHILIKTDSGDILGQLYDFRNESIIMLKENEVFKAIPWDQIKTIEITNKEGIKEQPTKVFKNEAINPR